MRAIMIHNSGTGADRLEVVSYGNGTAYAFNFGETDAPMRDLFLQGDDALRIREEYEVAENANPDRDCRNIWLDLLDPYL